MDGALGPEGGRREHRTTIDEITWAVAREHPDLPEDAIREAVQHTFDRLAAEARYTTYVPLLTRRYVLDGIRQLEVHRSGQHV